MRTKAKSRKSKVESGEEAVEMGMRRKEKNVFYKKNCGTLAYIKYYLYFCTLI